jgi:hypothetical protein
MQGGEAEAVLKVDVEWFGSVDDLHWMKIG